VHAAAVADGTRSSPAILPMMPETLAATTLSPLAVAAEERLTR